MQQFGFDERLEPILRELERVSDLDERMARVLAHDYSGLSQPERYSFIQQTLVYLPFVTTVLRPYSADLFPVYRARKNLDEKIEDTRLWRTFSYPSPYFCAGNGRANLLRRPVFYASDHPVTALAETHPADGDVIYLSEWMIRCHRSPVTCSVFPLDISPANPWRSIAANKNKAFEEHITATFGAELQGRLRQISKFISDRFVEDGDPYTITSCLAYNWLYRHNVVDYIVYPSFQTMSETCNIAFAPNFADEFMRLDRVFRLRMHRADEEAATFEITHVGENWGNMIAWRKPRRDESFDWIGIRGDIFPAGSWPDDVELDQSAPFQD